MTVNFDFRFLNHKSYSYTVENWVFPFFPRIGEKIYPYGGWLMPVKEEHNLSDNEHKFTDGFIIVDVCWGPNEFDEYKLEVLIEVAEYFKHH